MLAVQAVVCLEVHRELESVEVMARRNQEDGDLVGLAFTDPMHHVKHVILKGRQPEVIALGTSRVLAFRDYFFDDSSGFYNCGRFVGKVQDFESFLTSYPEKKPRIILLGLDQDFFGVDDDDLEKPPRSYVHQKTSYGTRLIKGTKALIDVLKDGKLESGEVMPEATSYIGKNARLYSEGYRGDGSYLYGRLLHGKKVSDDYAFKKTISRIEKRKGRFAAAERIHPGAVNDLERFLDLCKSDQIHVVAFLPPYANKVYRRFAEERAQFPHVFELHAALEPVFLERVFRLFDFSDLASVGSNDFETYDGFHASETAYLKMLRLMAKDDAELGGRLNMGAVDGMLSSLFSARQVVQEIEEVNPERPAVSGE